MPETEISQAEADLLLSMEKIRTDDEPRNFPRPGENIPFELKSVDGRESFALDVVRGRISISKCTYQNRARGIIILARLDLDGGPHRNPDGQYVPCPHIHLYREGYGDKWAWPVAEVIGGFTDDLRGAYDQFCSFCNITKPPHLQRGLF
jgi:hypothetical protein